MDKYTRAATLFQSFESILYKMAFFNLLYLCIPYIFYNKYSFSWIFINLYIFINLIKKNLNRFIESFSSLFFSFRRSLRVSTISTIGCTWIIRFRDSRKKLRVGNFSNGWPNCTERILITVGREKCGSQSGAFLPCNRWKMHIEGNDVRSCLLLYTDIFTDSRAFKLFYLSPQSGHLYRY